VKVEDVCSLHTAWLDYFKTRVDDHRTELVADDARGGVGHEATIRVAENEDASRLSTIIGENHEKKPKRRHASA
jgi:hypothetical protein